MFHTHKDTSIIEDMPLPKDTSIQAKDILDFVLSEPMYSSEDIPLPEDTSAPFAENLS